MKWFLPLLFALALAMPAVPQTQPPAQPSQTSKELEVTGNQPWTDTAIDLQPGQTVTITATGKLQYMDGTSPGPQGGARSWRDLIRAMPVNSAGRGALIGRWGSDEAAQPFLIGASLQLPVRVAGRLFLGINGPQATLPMEASTSKSKSQVTLQHPPRLPLKFRINLFRV